MNTATYRVAAFRKFVAQVVEWDPDEHDGERESWESMEATMDAGWAGKLAANGCQETMDPPVTERDTNPVTEVRRVVREAWVLPSDVPAELAAQCRESALHGYLSYDPDTGHRTLVAADVRTLEYGDRLTHSETGTPAIVETVSIWGDGRIEVRVRFGGDPRTDDWGPFREAPMYSADSLRDLERITIERGEFSQWARA